MTFKEKLKLVINNMTEGQCADLFRVLNINMPERHKCMCCGYYTLVGNSEEIAYDICDVCYWENDGCKNDEDFSTCNHMTLGQARENFRKYGACDMESAENVREPKYYEMSEYNE